MRKKDNSPPTEPAVPTLKEVAQLVGVSTATASRALAGAAGVRKVLRSQILEAAHSISYLPNRAARDLPIVSLADRLFLVKLFYCR